MSRSLRYTTCLIVGWSLAITSLGAGAAPASTSGGLITEPVDEHVLVTLHGNVRPEAINANDRGPVADDLLLAHMQLKLLRSPQREQALQRLLEQIQTPGSPQFHHWLTPQQLGEQFGPASSDISKVTSWLSGHGFKVNAVPPSRMLIDFSGTARQVRAAFHTQIHHLLVNGEPHIGNMSEPQIPAALAPVIAGVVSLDDFRPRAMN